MTAFDTAWNLMKGKTLRSKRAARNNKERKEIKAMRDPRQLDSGMLERLMRELGIGYSGSEFDPKED
jgi:hypothetical protein